MLGRRRARALALFVLTVLPMATSPAGVAAVPVPVRAPEASAHGFLVLRDAGAAVLAQGDWWQVPSGERIEVHLRFRFTDGSLSHETFVLAQRRVWTMLSYHSVQRGPSFPRDIDGRVDRDPGRYTVQTHDRDKGTSKVDEGSIELPADAYAFGMLALLLQSLPPSETLSAQALAFTPKPRLLKLQVTPDGEETVTVEGLRRTTRRYVARAELGGALGVAASVLGKQPPRLRYWMAGEPVPTFVRFDGPFYPDGPIWRVELAAPHWPGDRRPS
jgi:hypothetical protein